jgi:hypothetical protein
MNTISFTKVILAALCIMLLSACGSLPDMLSFSSDDELTSAQNSISPETQNAIEQADLRETQRILNGVVEEWQLLKPEINRVIKLEGELVYLVDSFNKSSEIDKFVDSDLELVEGASVAELAGVRASGPTFIGQSNVQSATNIKESVPMTTQKNSSSELLVGRAKALPKIPVTTKSNAGVSDDKFSSLNANNARSNQTNSAALVANTTQADKFNRQPLVNIKQERPASQSGACKNSLSNTGVFAIHLSSLSQSSNIDGAVSKLSNTFSDILCNKQVKTQLVEVDGVDYSSIRFGPYSSEESATQACSSVRVRGSYCKVTRFTGESI